MYDFRKQIEKEPFTSVTTVARQTGTSVYVIGGFVRDLLLGRPSKDVDFVVAGSGIAFARQLAEYFGHGSKARYFKNFGTAMIRFKGWELEFVGARKESYRKSSRKPIVEDGTLEDDQRRRDFTINALSVSLNELDFGQMNDPFNGLKDMEAKIIRTPLDPDITFSDDPLRMMRAIRFATQLEFAIEVNTFAAIKRNKNRISIVSRERVIDELNKVILADKPGSGFKMLDDTGLLKQIFPAFTELKGVEVVGGKGHKDNFYHTLEVLDNVAKVSGRSLVTLGGNFARYCQTGEQTL